MITLKNLKEKLVNNNFIHYKALLFKGLWTQNAGLVQLLGLCPVLAVSSTIVNGFSLGLATTFVMILSNISIASLRQFIPNEIRIPAFILIIALLVTAVDLLINVYFHDLYLVLGIFIPLIVTNCIVLARVEVFASKNKVFDSTVDALGMGLGLTSVLIILGGIREIFATGTLFKGIDMIFGKSAQSWVITLFDHYQGFLLASLPAGAFLGLGLLIALKNYIDQKLMQSE